MENRTVVGVLIKEDKVLIVERKKEDGIRFSFPGGEMKKNEHIMEAVEREVLEETGITANAEEHLGSRVHPTTNVHIDYFGMEYIKGEISVTDPEIINAQWVDCDGVSEFLGDGVFEGVLEFLK